MSKQVPTKALIAAFQKFMVGKRVVIADPSGTARGSMASLLGTLGIKASDMVLASSYQVAEEEVKRVKPHVIITDYDISAKRCGLDLIPLLKANHPALKDTLFILVTGNTSQSAVAKAAEEDVDSFILKPFTPDSFRTTILRTVYTKVEPTDYMKQIEVGKDLLAAGSFDEAIAAFKQAKSMDEAPALACFYLGQANIMKQVLNNAEGNFVAGLNYNKIHYKCLVGLYEALMNQKRHADAYNVIKRISHYFPANPQRMTAVLRLAIMTKSYEDVERYYRMFTNIEVRHEEMVKYVCAALVVCGKYYLQISAQSRALELFEKAAITAAGRTRILREIIMSLMGAELPKQAEEFMKRFPADTQKGVDYLTSSLLVAESFQGRGIVIDKGRQLIQQGIHDPLIYEVLIRKCCEAGLKDAAEEFAQKASGRWPEQKGHFNNLFNTSADAAAAKAKQQAAAS